MLVLTVLGVVVLQVALCVVWHRYVAPNLHIGRSD